MRWAHAGDTMWPNAAASFQRWTPFLFAHPVWVCPSPDATTPEAFPPEEQEGGASGEETHTMKHNGEKKTKTKLVVNGQDHN